MNATNVKPVARDSKFRTAGAARALIAMAAACALAAGCGGGKKAAPALDEVEAAKAARGSIGRSVLFTGNILAKDAVDVYPRANGKVTKKLLKEGDPVKRGQAILLIDRDEVGYSFKPLAVESPIDGFVGTIDVDVGTYVYDRSVFSQKPVAVVVHPGPMRVRIDVPERYLDAIKLGTKVEMKVDALGEEKYDGTIVTSSPVVDEKTRTARIEIDVPNSDGRLRHGMFGRIDLVVEQHDGVIVVPAKAVSWEGDKQFVYRLSDGRVHRVQVKPGLRNEEDVEIVEGLDEGVDVAVGNLLQLEDGEAVTVKP